MYEASGIISLLVHGTNQHTGDCNKDFQEVSLSLQSLRPTWNGGSQGPCCSSSSLLGTRLPLSPLLPHHLLCKNQEDLLLPAFPPETPGSPSLNHRIIIYQSPKAIYKMP